MTALSAFRDLIIFGAHRTWIPLWNGKFNTDPMHSSGGLFTLVKFLLLFLVSLGMLEMPMMFDIENVSLNLTSHICIYWIGFYWLRNIFYHIILRKAEFIEWEYLLPFGGLI